MRVRRAALPAGVAALLVCDSGEAVALVSESVADDEVAGLVAPLLVEAHEDGVLPARHLPAGLDDG